MTTASPRRRPALTSRHTGFTVVELLMVILIIGILAALLFPAIQRSMITVRETEVLTEIKGLEKGIVDFKGRYGVDPPSFIVLYEQGEGNTASPSWSTASPAGAGVTDAHRRASRAIIRQIWPDFDFSYAGGFIDINGNGADDDVIVLSGAECLVFFLGGVTEYPVPVPNNPNSWATLGFSANPQYPFATGGNRFGPFVTFDPARLVDLDGDQMPEFIDTLSGQELPYQYLSSYDGRGYQPYGLNGIAGDTDDEIGFGLWRIYYQSPPFNITDAIPTNARPFNPDTFQIISPGRDFEYGLGGYYNGESIPAQTEDANGNDILDPGEDVNGNGVIDSRPAERDNITNFKGGRLN